MEMQKIAVIGAGTMGHGLAMVFAQGGCKVRLQDITGEALQKAKSLITANLDTLADAKMFDPSQREQLVNERIIYTTDLAQAVAGVDMAVEAVFEDEQLKKGLFSRLEELAPNSAVLASNTSFLNIYKFVDIAHPERLIITHWYVPPHIVPLVEIVPGSQTDPALVERVRKFHEELGKEPMVLNKFLEGFIGNRLQAALNLEVLYLIDNGYATPEDIDRAAKASFGLRLPILGLVKRMDYTGLNITSKVLASKAYQPPEVRGRSEVLDKLIAQGHLGVKTGKGFYDYGNKPKEELLQERDLKLLKLKALLEQMSQEG